MMEKLSLPETAILLILMAEAREISNPELKDRYGLTLDGKSRVKLNDRLKLVDSRRQGRSFVHVLNEAGWGRCAEELSVSGPPSRAGSAGAALYALLAGLGRYINRSDKSLAEIFGEVDRGSWEAAAQPRSELDLEARIRKAYEKSAPRPGAWVSLTQLRSLLDDVTKTDVDNVLRHMNQLADVNIVPESNQKMLTQADREAAVRLGGQDRHLISIEGT
jgi:hypothetical protein